MKYYKVFLPISAEDFMKGNYGDITMAYYKNKKYEHVFYDKKNKSIVIKLTNYTIELSRCKTSAQCLDWIHQLSEKTWMNPEMMFEFIDILFRLIDYSLWTGGQKIKRKMKNIKEINTI